MPLRSTFERVEAPGRIDRGRTYSARLTIRNRGTVAWTASGTIRLSYHWASPDGTTIVNDGLRTVLSHDVAPGEVVTVCASVQAPDRLGSARLRWDMVQEGVAWFSDGGIENTQTVDVEIDAPLHERTDYVFPILFVAATLLHFVLVAAWLQALYPGALDADALAFQTAVLGLGSLQTVLHGLAFTVGLSLGRGLAALAALHLVIACVWLRRRGREPGPATRRREPPMGGWTSRWLALGGGGLLAALVVQWCLSASKSLLVTGADAAHYHVPYAVNMALGANAFGLPATPHLYPMGTSVLAAWFILPFHDPLLVDSRRSAGLRPHVGCNRRARWP